MAGIPLIPGATVTSGTYTVYDSNSSSGNKNKTPVELVSSGNTWTGVNSFSAKPTYKFLQSMNIEALDGIDLGYKMSLDTDDYEIKIKWSSSSTNEMAVSCGGTEAGAWWLYKYEAGGHVAMYAFTSTTAQNNIVFTSTAESFKVHTYAVKGKKGYLDGNYVGELPAATYPTASYNLKLFCGGGTYNAQYCTKGTFYGFKVWQKGELTHEYVPCMKYNTSGVAESVGIYDLISNQYFTRNNSVELNNNLEASSADWAYRQGISEEGFLYDSFAVQVTNLNTDTLAGVGVGGDAVIDTAYNAVWNDMVDLIEVPEDTDLKFGKCYCFDGETYKESSKYLDDGFMGIHSDTSGMLLGYKGEDKKHLQAAIAGFALAYVDKEYPVGTPLTCGENGFLTELKKEDLPNNSHKLVGTFWKKEWSDWWGFERAKTENLVTLVDGRMWVKVR